MTARHRAHGTSGGHLLQCGVNLKKFWVGRKLFLFKNMHILVVSCCYVWRPKSTKSNDPYDRPLWLYLVPTMVNKQGPSGPVSSFYLTSWYWCQIVPLKHAESPVLATSRLRNFQTCSAGRTKFMGGQFTLI